MSERPPLTQLVLRFKLINHFLPSFHCIKYSPYFQLHRLPSVPLSLYTPMEISLSSPLSRNPPPFPLSTTPSPHNFQIHRLFSSSPYPNSISKFSSISPLICRHNHSIRAQDQNRNPVENGGFVLEDVPHLTNFLPDLPVCVSLSLHILCIYIYKMK